MVGNVKIKRSIAIPLPVDKWLERTAKKQGYSVSALVTHLLLTIMEKEQTNDH